MINTAAGAANTPSAGDNTPEAAAKRGGIPIYSRLADLEDKVESARQDIAANVASLRDAMKG